MSNRLVCGNSMVSICRFTKAFKRRLTFIWIVLYTVYIKNEMHNFFSRMYL